MTEYDFYYDYNALIKKFINSEIIPQTWNIIDTNCVELRYLENGDTIIETDYISEITAVFTTANARVRLYKMMDWLDPSQVAYCDTDSVILRYDADNPQHKDPYNKDHSEDAKLKGLEFGTGLGQWEDEFKGKDYITELVIGGAKSYAYTTASRKIVIKQKRNNIIRDNDTVVNFETFKKMVLDNIEIVSKPRHQFRWEEKSKKNVVIKYISKKIKATIGEKRELTDNYDTLPFR